MKCTDSSDSQLAAMTLPIPIDACRPNLFVVGAMKSGTTTLHASLKRHPEVFMSADKEPNYFIATDARPEVNIFGQASDEESLGIYLDLFREARGFRYAGEASTSYTRRPRLGCAAEAIHRFNPSARIIYIMRDPIERTLSHYWWDCRWSQEARGPLEAIADEAQYRDCSHYAMQMRPYLERFGREQVYILTLEELSQDAGGEEARLFRWLGLEADLAGCPPAIRENTTPKIILQKRNRMLVSLQKSKPYRAVRHLIPKLLRDVANEWGKRPVDRTQTDLTAVKEFLRPLQREQTAELADLFGRAFPQWKTLYGN
jgi:hypothetical protein